MSAKASTSDGLLLAPEDRAAAALHELPEALVLVFDRELHFLLSAGEALERLGNPPACRPGQPLEGALPAELWPSLEPLLLSALDGETRSREVWTPGTRRCLMVETGPLSLSEQAPTPAGQAAPCGIAVILDVTERRWADELTRGALGNFAELFHCAPIATGLLDLDGRWLLVNRALCEISGYTPDELLGKRLDGIVHSDDAFKDRRQRERLLAGEIAAYQVEKRHFDAAGEIVSAIVSFALVRDAVGTPVHYIVQMQDISERKQLEEHLRHLADHDPLTGLRNRRLFNHDLRLQLARARRYGETAALLMIDLDGFKQVNDRHGHVVGDEMLRAVAKGLTRRLRETDLVARLGGDEFAVLLAHIDADGADVVAKSLEHMLPACSVDAGEEILHPSASIGMALIDEHAEGADQVLERADRAMYEAKRHGPSPAA